MHPKFYLNRSLRYAILAFVPFIYIISIGTVQVSGQEIIGTHGERFITPIVVTYITIFIGQIVLQKEKRILGVMTILLGMDIFLFFLSDKTLGDFVSRIFFEGFMQFVSYMIINAILNKLSKTVIPKKYMQASPLYNQKFTHTKNTLSLIGILLILIWVLL